MDDIDGATQYIYGSALQLNSLVRVRPVLKKIRGLPKSSMSRMKINQALLPELQFW
jgi:hypothetical protein